MTSNPFGKAACEAEIMELGSDRYSSLYFAETPFNEAAQLDETYLVIGRRGSGKTALAQAFSFAMRNRAPLCIDVRHPEDYQRVLADISRRTSATREIAVYELRKVWEFVIWNLIANRLPACRALQLAVNLSDQASNNVADLISYLITMFDDKTTPNESLNLVIRLSDLNAVKECAIQAARKQPIIITIDTLEHTDLGNQAQMHAIAALVEYASEFNLKHARHNIHLKVFVSGEIFPHLEESVLLAPAKVIRNAVYMLWRPRDLLRLICWRLHRHLRHTTQLDSWPEEPKWESPDDVLTKVWQPHFGRSLTNARGLQEDTWSYILRHTQMRPRQVITICNAIAKRAIASRTFPQFSNDQIVEGTQDAERELASEIINSFSAIYPRIGQIVGALMHIPMVFDGNELDRRAPQTASEWEGDYSAAAFRRLVTELGIVGRVTRADERNFIDADFQYSMKERLTVTNRDRCVIHPMFYRRLRVVFNTQARVMPFGIG